MWLKQSVLEWALDVKYMQDMLSSIDANSTTEDSVWKSTKSSVVNITRQLMLCCGDVNSVTYMINFHPI